MQNITNKQINTRFIIRSISFLKRFFLCILIMGFINAIKIIVYPLFFKRLTKIKFNKKLFYYYPKYDQGVMSHFYSKNYFIKEGNNHKIKYILDLGANIGVETFRFAQFYPGCQIISVEPFKRNFNLLEKNFQNYHNVTLINKPIWSSKTLLNSNIIDNSFENIVYSEVVNNDSKKTNINSVESTTIQNIFEEYKLPFVDILKMDCEGSEKFFFNNLPDNMLKNIKCIIIEVSDNQNELMMQSVLKKFMDIEFRFHIVGEDIVLIRNDCDLSCHSVYGLEN